MTREEAIEILRPFRDAMIDQHGCPISDAVFALDVAIEALNREHQIIENGYTGKEMRIRIGGRLFAVRELAQ